MLPPGRTTRRGEGGTREIVQRVQCGIAGDAGNYDIGRIGACDAPTLIEQTLARVAAFERADENVRDCVAGALDHLDNKRGAGHPGDFACFGLSAAQLFARRSLREFDPEFLPRGFIAQRRVKRGFRTRVAKASIVTPSRQKNELIGIDGGAIQIDQLAFLGRGQIRSAFCDRPVDGPRCSHPENRRAIHRATAAPSWAACRSA